MSVNDFDGVLDKLHRNANLDLHRAGHVPSSRVATIIRDEERLLEELNTRLIGEIARLNEQRERVRMQAALHRSMLSPARRVPPEIWSDIFILSLTEAWLKKPVDMRPLPLAQVCSRWRTIALQTPRIWANVNIDFHTGIFENQSVCCNPAVLRRELVKTGQAPLSVSIQMPDYDERSDRTSLLCETMSEMGIWRTLFSESHRWECIEFSDMSLAAIRTEAADLQLPSLRHLGWYTHDSGLSDIIQEIPLGIFTNAPVLRSLYISYRVTPVKPVKMPSTWALTRLNIAAVSDEPEPHIAIGPCIPLILACSASLVHCSISAANFGHFPEGQPRISFPALRELHLQWAAIHICRLISAPSLQVVRLIETAIDDHPVDELDAFVSLVDSSDECKSLRSLELIELPCSCSRVIECLQRLPSLERLSLSNSILIPLREPAACLRLIRTLTRTSDPRSLVFLPNLAELYLGYMFGHIARPGGEDDAVREMVASRRSVRELDGQPLACLRRFCCDSADTSLDALIPMDAVANHH